MCALCVFAGMMLERWRQEDKPVKASIRASEARIEHRAKHRASQPRETPPAAARPDRTTLTRSGYRDSWHGVWREPLGATPTAPAHVAAEHIDSVLLAPAPAPDLHGAADTGRLPSLGPLTDTGAFQAISDWGDQMQVAIETGTL
jgi:hypothetical protein